MNKQHLSLLDQYVDVKERLVALEKLLSDPSSECYIERLLDVIVACVNESGKIISRKKNENIVYFLQRFLDVTTCLQSLRRKTSDFAVIGSLGHGAFGRVQLVRETSTGRICAMKMLRKSRMLTQHTDYWAEREIMSRGESPWIVQLYYAFQDPCYLYMVMEFVPGGNLVSWMDEVEIMSEAACRFYAAETILALSDLHAMGFIHRDLKPDNLLLDAGGHLKLADFGTAVRVDSETSLTHCDSAVGTPDYLSPEVLLSQGIGGGSYGFEVDWWALGVIIYEMLYGVTPFYSETLVNTYANIMNHVNSLKFPDTVNISDAGLNFMKGLLCDRNHRLGSQSQSMSAVYDHPWFSCDWVKSQQTCGQLDSMDLSIADWSWSNIRACRAPFQPQLQSETDMTYFQVDTDDEDFVDDIEQTQDHQSLLERLSNESSENDVAESKDLLHGSSVTKFETADKDRSLLELPGSQLVFAGFSFASPHPHRLALLTGLYLTPGTSSANLCALRHSDTHVKPFICDNPVPDSENDQLNTLTTTTTKVPDDSHNSDTAIGAVESHTPTPQHVIDDSTSETDSCVQRNVNAESMSKRFSFQMRLSTLQEQLEDALMLSDVHLNEVNSLTLQLEQAGARYSELESKLNHMEHVNRVANEEAEQQLESMKAEAAANCCRLEAEIAKWKSLAQSEKTARQSAETAGNIAAAAATDELARRAAEIADRLSRPGTRSNLSLGISSPTTNEYDQSNWDQLLLNNELGINTINLDQTDVGLTGEKQLSPTDLLLRRVAEMVKRAHQAEALAQESTDQLEAEKHFSRLYKETCAEKSDQLAEQKIKLDRVHDLYKQSCTIVQRTKEDYEAALRALKEEQQRASRYREEAKTAEEHAYAATQRATFASREVAQLRHDLEQMTQAYRKEQANCTATVNKLTEVLSGKNADTLELMWLASFQQQQQGEQHNSTSPFFAGSNSARSKVANLKGLGQQKRLNLQLNQRVRENKRLVSEINRLNDELSSMRKMYENKMLASESRCKTAESELLLLKEQLKQSKQSPVELKSQFDHLHASSTSSTESNERKQSLNVTSLKPLQRDVPVMKNSLFPAQATTANSTIVKPTPLLDKCIIGRNLYGLLEVGPKRGKRNKLQWESRFAQLNATHLLLWDVPNELTKRVTEFRQKKWDLSNFVADFIHSNQQLPVRFELLLNAVYHVRSVNSCDVFHERVEDLPRIFQVIYDRQSTSYAQLHHQLTSNVVTPTHVHDTPSSLIRKYSFGSSTLFSTLNPNQFGPGRRMLRTESTTANQTIQTNPMPPVNQSSMDASPLSSSSNITAKIDQTLVSPMDVNTIYTKGHTLQRIQFRSSTSCDLCQAACWHVFHPPLAYQCTDCQIKLHATHLDNNEYTLPQCSKAVGVCLFRAQTEADKQQWMDRIAFLIKLLKSDAATPQLEKSSRCDRSVVPIQQKSSPCTIASSDGLNNESLDSYSSSSHSTSPGQSVHICMNRDNQGRQATPQPTQQVNAFEQLCAHVRSKSSIQESTSNTSSSSSPHHSVAQASQVNKSDNFNNLYSNQPGAHQVIVDDNNQIIMSRSYTIGLTKNALGEM